MAVIHGVNGSGADVPIRAKRNAGLVSARITPSQFDTTLTMNGTAQTGALASGVGVVRFLNRGATTEPIRVAFGASAALAAAALNVSGGAATTGYFIGAAADNFDAEAILGVPDNATHYAVANATASDTQAVEVTQG